MTGGHRSRPIMVVLRDDGRLFFPFRCERHLAQFFPDDARVVPVLAFELVGLHRVRFRAMGEQRTIAKAHASYGLDCRVPPLSTSLAFDKLISFYPFEKIAWNVHESDARTDRSRRRLRHNL